MSAALDATRRSGLVSSIDLAPTILELGGAAIPETFQGVSLRPLLNAPDARVRRFVFSEHNWHDYAANARAVRDGEHLYILNLRPDDAWQGPADSVRSPSHAALESAAAAGKLTAAQRDVLVAPRPAEELYLTARDPNQLKNLVDDSKHAGSLRRLREVMKQWREETADRDPSDPSKDGFDRKTGERLFPGRDTPYYRTPAGADRQAHRVNKPGPR